MAKLDGGIGALITQLVSEIDDIESMDIPQGEKTGKYKAAATKLKNRLYLDKRRYRGAGEKKRLALNTVNNYITRIRRQFDDRLHHHFYSSVERLAGQYPIYASELLEWLDLPAAEIRKRYGSLCEQLQDIATLAELLSDIKYGHAGAKKLQRISQKYPRWSAYIQALADDEWKEAQKELYQAFQQGTKLLDDLGKLKINHEILYHLQLSPSERASIQKRWDDVLSEKKRSVVVLDYPSYMQSVTNILYAPFAPEHVTQKQGLAAIAFALAAVSGRRMIEIVANGEFEVAGRYEVMFKGQAKKRVGSENGTRKIYTLCDSKLFVQRLYELRRSPAAADFVELKLSDELDDASFRAANVRITSGLAKSFNQFAKDFFKDDRRTFKDTRAIYARITYEMFFRLDSRWKNVDEDVFFSEILGHDDEGTQLHYKQFKLHNFSRSWRPNAGVENRRLAALQELDPEMPNFAKGDAGIRIHEAVKQLVESGGDIVINTNTLRKAGFNPTLVRRYLDFAADALGQTVGDNGWIQADIAQPDIVISSDEEQDELELDEHETIETDATALHENEEQEDRPRFKAPRRAEDGAWIIEFTYHGRQYYWSGDADNLPSAMKAAWENYF